LLIDSPPSLVRIRTAKNNVMKCHSDIISSPLLKEPLKKGNSNVELFYLNSHCNNYLVLKVGKGKLSIDPLLALKGETCVTFIISLHMGKNSGQCERFQITVRISSALALLPYFL